MKVKLADLVIEIKNDDVNINTLLKDYLSDGDIDFSIEITQEDIDNEHHIFNIQEFDYEVSESQFILLALQRKISDQLYKYNAILYHGSALRKGDFTILLTGKSGAGKSTHARLYRDNYDDVMMINDDKPFIRIFEDEIKIYGSPWDGKHHLSNNVSYPLNAICFINQDLDNHIEIMDKEDILPKLFGQTYRTSTKEGLSKTMNLINEIKNRVPVYNMFCNMEAEAVEVSYKGMKHE